MHKVELLESRRMLSAAPLVIEGTSGDDQIELDVDPSGSTLTLVRNNVLTDIPLIGVAAIQVNGLEGNDSLTFGASAGRVDLFGGLLSIDGGPGADRAEFHGESMIGGSGFKVETATQIRVVNSPLAYGGIEQLSFYSGGGFQRFHQVVHPPADVRIDFIDGPGRSIFDILETLGTGRVYISNTDLTDVLIVKESNAVTAEVVFPDPVSRWGALIVYKGGRAFLGDPNDPSAPPGVLYTKHADFIFPGVVDLRDGVFIYDYSPPGPFVRSPLPEVTRAIRGAYNHGNWDGDGLSSSVADADEFTVGVAEASEVLGITGDQTATFAGVTIDAHAVVARSTRYGDANLDGRTDIADFAILASRFNSSGGWAQGDFNNDEAVDLGDFSLMGSNFNQTQIAPRAASPNAGQPAADSAPEVGRRVAEDVLP